MIEPSGVQWCGRFPTSNALTDLVQPFQDNVVAFIAALRAAGASVEISATYRPAERAYLMHWCWQIATGAVAPADVPPIAGVDIDWTHDGNMEAARTAAILMKHEYGMAHVAELISRHTQRRAIDMTIRFQGAIQVRTRHGTLAAAACLTDLIAVGRSYGVIKLESDPPHWSDDGH